MTAIVALAARGVNPRAAIPMITWPWVLLWCWRGGLRKQALTVSAVIRGVLFASLAALLLNIGAYAFETSAQASFFGFTYVGVLLAAVAAPIAVDRAQPTEK